MVTMIIKKGLTYLVFIAVGIIIALLFKGCDDGTKEQLTIYEHLEDSTQFFKNKYNEAVGRNTVLESSSVSNFLAIQTKNAEILELQKRVKDYKDKIKNNGSVTNFSSNTTIDNTTSTTVTDTLPVMIDSVPHYFPKYSTTYSDEWINYSINATKDSIGVKLNTKDKYSVIIGEERPKMFKKKVPFVEVISESPYTELKSVKTYRVTEKRRPNRVSISVQGGYGYTLFGLSPYVGVGMSFNLLNIK